MSLGPHLDPALQRLLQASGEGGCISLDEIGSALGTAAVSAEDIDALLTALEAKGRTVGGSAGLTGREALQQVLVAARELVRHGKKPRVDEIATATGLPESEVQKALLLARVLGR